MKRVLGAILWAAATLGPGDGIAGPRMAGSCWSAAALASWCQTRPLLQRPSAPRASTAKAPPQAMHSAPSTSRNTTSGMPQHPARPSIVSDRSRPRAPGSGPPRLDARRCQRPMCPPVAATCGARRCRAPGLPTCRTPRLVPRWGQRQRAHASHRNRLHSRAQIKALAVLQWMHGQQTTAT